MENPFLLAVALLESREIATRFLRRTMDRKADSPMGVEEPINWQLLVDDNVQPEVRRDRFSPKTFGHTPAPGLEQVTDKSCV
jgi:hypothetical protein